MLRQVHQLCKCFTRVSQLTHLHIFSKQPSVSAHGLPLLIHYAISHKGSDWISTNRFVTMMSALPATVGKIWQGLKMPQLVAENMNTLARTACIFCLAMPHPFCAVLLQNMYGCGPTTYCCHQKIEQDTHCIFSIRICAKAGEYAPARAAQLECRT